MTPYDAVDASVPVDATELVTSPVVTAPVRYRVDAVALAGRPPTAMKAAPTPTTASRTMARILSFMRWGPFACAGGSVARRHIRRGVDSTLRV